MGRRRNTVIDDLLGIFALLPWWVGVASAVAAWAGFSHLAASFAGSTQPVHVLIATVAGLARWGAPLVCLVGALMSALGRRKRAGLLASASGGDGAAAIAGLSWADFELLVGESFRARGYTVKETGGGGADGGVDLIAWRDGRTTLVQCKHWKTYTVGVPVVREMLGLMTARGAAEGCVITSGRFTTEAQQFAVGRSITLVDGAGLAALLREGKAASRRSAVAPAPAPAAAAAASATGSPPVD
jgi:restriction system protein